MSGRYFSLVLWGCISEDTGDCKLFINLPSGSYNSAAGVTADTDKYANFTIPPEFKGTGFLISQWNLKHLPAASGTWTSVDEVDLRGLFPGISAGTGTAASTQFPDNTFRIFDDLDSTKLIAFQASGLTTATTRTLTVQDADGIIALSGVANYGTGATSFTDHGILLGSGTNPITATAAPTDGQLLIGSTGVDPVLSTLTAPASGISITGGAGSITFALTDDLAGLEALATTGIVSRTAANTYDATSVTQHAILIGDTGEKHANLGPLTDGQLVIGSTGNAPSAATLTAGSGISITGGAGSITIASTGSGMGYTEVTGTTQAMAVNTAYGANNASGVAFTLPSTASAGTVIEVVGIAGLSTIGQNAGQTIFFGSVNSTTGVGGSIVGTNAGDCVTIRCITANTDFRVTASVGNWTIN